MKINMFKALQEALLEIYMARWEVTLGKEDIVQ